MDINQKLELVDFNVDILTENDVVDSIIDDSSKLVTAKAVFTSLSKLSSDQNGEIVKQSEKYQSCQQN